MLGNAWNQLQRYKTSELEKRPSIVCSHVKLCCLQFWGRFLWASWFAICPIFRGSVFLLIIISLSLLCSTMSISWRTNGWKSCEIVRSHTNWHRGISSFGISKEEFQHSSLGRGELFIGSWSEAVILWILSSVALDRLLYYYAKPAPIWRSNESIEWLLCSKIKFNRSPNGKWLLSNCSHESWTVSFPFANWTEVELALSSKKASKIWWINQHRLPPSNSDWRAEEFQG